MNMNKSKLISIIVPAFNIEDYIERCLASLLNQSYYNLEIIVVNDGSTDNTKEKVEEIVQSDARVKIISTENRGVSHARNIGIAQAKGEYIGFVDGDDEVEVDMYEVLIKNAHIYNADISHCGYKMVFPSKQVEYYGSGIIKKQSKKEALGDLLSGYPIEPGLCNKLYRRELFKSIRLNESIRYNEDLLANFYLFELADKSVYLDETKYHYILRKNSAATSKNNIKKMKDPVKVWEEILILVSGDPTLYEIALKRFLHVLVNNILYFEPNINEDIKKYQKVCKMKLREQLKNNRNVYLLKSLKIFFLLYGSSYFPFVMKNIKRIYNSFHKNKYKLEG